MSVQLLGNKWRNTTVEGRNLGWRKRGREVKTAAEIEVGKRERRMCHGVNVFHHLSSGR